MNPKRALTEISVRFLCLLLGLFILAQGIAFTIPADLGTDAITSPALVAHLVLGDAPGGMGYSFCTVGRMLICIHVILVLAQVALLRGRYRPIQLLQVVMGLIPGTIPNFCQPYTKITYRLALSACLVYPLHRHVGDITKTLHPSRWVER